MADSKAKRRMVVPLDPELHEQLREVAERTGASIRATAARLIAEGTERELTGPAAVAAGPGDRPPQAHGGGHRL
jgi:predicted transcriptional regulator